MAKVKIILEIIRVVIPLPHQRITFRYHFPVCQFCSLYWLCQFNGWYCQTKIWQKANDADFSWIMTHAVYLINRTIVTRYNSFVRILLTWCNHYTVMTDLLRNSIWYWPKLDSLSTYEYDLFWYRPQKVFIDADKSAEIKMGFLLKNFLMPVFENTPWVFTKIHRVFLTSLF